MPQKQKSAADIFYKTLRANRNAMKVQTLLLTKTVKKFAIDMEEGVS